MNMFYLGPAYLIIPMCGSEVQNLWPSTRSPTCESPPSLNSLKLQTCKLGTWATKKGPLMVQGNAIQWCGDSVINHERRIPMKLNSSLNSWMFFSLNFSKWSLSNIPKSWNNIRVSHWFAGQNISILTLVPRLPDQRVTRPAWEAPLGPKVASWGMGHLDLTKFWGLNHGGKPMGGGSLPVSWKSYEKTPQIYTFLKNWGFVDWVPVIKMSF